MKTKLALVCIALLFISSCTPSTQRRDLLEIITNSSCEPPCWRGITPGETTFSEAKVLVQAIQTNATGNNEMIRGDIWFDDENERILINFDRPRLHMRIHSTNNGIIKNIMFWVDSGLNIYQIKLQDMIHYFGEPDTIDFCYGSGETRGAIIGFSSSQVEYNFYKPRLPFNIDTFEFPISKNSRIDIINYNDSWVNPGDKIFSPWTGYGSYQFTPPDPNGEMDCGGN